MGVKLGFHEAALHASFTPRATLAAVRVFGQHCCPPKLRQGLCPRQWDFMKQRFMPVLRHEQKLKALLSIFAQDACGSKENS